MSTNHIPEELKKKAYKPEPGEKEESGRNASKESLLISLHHQIGNRAVQRLMNRKPIQSGIDEETSKVIHQQRGHGLSLDTGVQREMGAAMGHDFSQVQVHTSPQADKLNHDLDSAAFTTGNDIFFRQGLYQPGSSSGQELIAHELTHIVQQSGSQVEPGAPLTLGEPDDIYEKQADEIALASTQHKPYDFDKQESPEEENVLTKRLSDSVQFQELKEDEEDIRTKSFERAAQSETITDEEDLSASQMREGDLLVNPDKEEEK